MSAYDDDPRVKQLRGRRGAYEVAAPSGTYEVSAMPPYWDDWEAWPDEKSPWAEKVGPCTSADEVFHRLLGDPQ